MIQVIKEYDPYIFQNEVNQAISFGTGKVLTTAITQEPDPYIISAEPVIRTYYHAIIQVGLE